MNKILTQESEHVEFLGAVGGGVKQIAVPINPVIHSTVGGEDEKGQVSSLQFLTHLGYALRVPSPNVIHTLTHKPHLRGELVEKGSLSELVATGRTGWVEQGRERERSWRTCLKWSG